MSDFHRSVLLKESIDYLNVRPNELYVDATLGGGGHTKEILNNGGRVIGIDVDLDAIDHIRDSLRSDHLIVEQDNFRNIDKILSKHGITEISGIIFDLGVSSKQLDTAGRGFSFSKSGPLDMRMGGDLKVTAADLVNGLTETELYELFFRSGEERYARRIARVIVRSRQNEKIEKTDQLAKIIEASIGRSASKIHPATKVFMALRMAVNSELDNLKESLEKSTNFLKIEGRLVVISFHSLEDRIVKNFVRNTSELVQINKKPIIPTEEEIKENPRSRSAKLRVAEKIA
ncbi:16S rRNA (cytosine(1402)-N(4))-methyltransferase RsmH [Patescibacteria group bacterium]|nr:16S rRNA (cytosine(1402)-N(4))-methyltransferase RsmH [Patescibacteria group bacterium]